MPIVIEHLTPEQHDMLDYMWNLESPEDFESWVDTLDDKCRRMALSLRELVWYEVIERDLRDVAQAREYLQRFQIGAA